jgi:hypothetical protein
MKDTRLQVHWAAQAVAALAADPEASFCWDAEREALTGRDRDSGLRVRDLTLLRGDATLPLTGLTLADAFAFFGRQVERPPYDLCDHAVAHGARFAPDAADLQRLAGLYAKAHRELVHFCDDVRAWPHHFDIAVLLTVGEGRTIGVGFSPGDALYDDPYWYVSPYPYPEDREHARELPSGFWNRQPWFGAVLMADDAADVREFLRAAVTALR